MSKHGDSGKSKRNGASGPLDSLRLGGGVDQDWRRNATKRDTRSGSSVLHQKFGDSGAVVIDLYCACPSSGYVEGGLFENWRDESGYRIR
jgi:hypothetical protein